MQKMWDGKMDHDRACNIVVDFWQDMVTQWAITNHDELRMWLHNILKLDSMSVDEIQKEFEPCFDKFDDNEYPFKKQIRK